MGISYRSKLMYGMYYSDLCENLSEEDIEQLDEDIDYGEIEYASPYYDSDRDDWFVGVEISCSTLQTLQDEVEEAEKYFINRFRVVGELRSCLDVT